MTNEDLFVFTTDWHLDRPGQTPATALSAAQFITAMQPAGAIDLGDCKDLHDGTDTGWQLDDYVSSVLNVMPWATVDPGRHPVLPGNHDDRNEDTVLPTDFSMFDTRLWGPPYHWTCDWQAPKVRFIAFHARIVKLGEGPALPYNGFFTVAQSEIDWVAAELDALPSGWMAIVCSHPPLAPAFGNNIASQWPYLTAYGGDRMLTVLRNRAPKVAAYLNGHRHQNMNTTVIDGITHFNGPGVAYTQGNGNGGFVPIDYDPAQRTLTFRYLLARAPFAPYPGYTPVVLTLPAIPKHRWCPYTLGGRLFGSGIASKGEE